jgi:DNA-binding MarR family transcriptional regulator
VVKVDSDFATEYPEGDASSTEAYASLVRAGTASLLELDRCIVASFGVPQPAATVLAVLDGSADPLTPSQIGERVLVASATMTANLDLLERRGWIRRTPNPDDRRSILVEITTDGRAIADRLLPGIRKVERRALDALTLDERVQLLDLLGKVLARMAEVAAQPPSPLDGERIRPARLDPPTA